MPSALAYAALLSMVAVTLSAVPFWVSQDAAARGSSAPTLWGAAAVLSGVVGLYYVFVYRAGRERSVPPTRGERVAATAVVADVGAMLVAATLAPPDPYTQATWWVGTFVLLLPVAYLLVYRRGYRLLPVVGSG